MKTRYFEIHISLSRDEGFSIFIEVPESEIGNNATYDDEEDAVRFAFEKNKIKEEHMPLIDYVSEIEEDEYKEAKGL